MSTVYQQSILNKAREDKFVMSFNLPPVLRKIVNNNKRSIATIQENRMQLSIFGSVVPEITVPAVEIPYAGSNLYNSAHARLPYPPVDVSFKVDNEFANYWLSYKWLDLLHDEKEGIFDVDNLTDDDLFKDYQTDMTIYGLDEFNKEKIKFTYTKAFPIKINSINYDYTKTDEIVSGMTFVYSQLHTILLDL